jgi:hypothetical protein
MGKRKLSMILGMRYGDKQLTVFDGFSLEKFELSEDTPNCDEAFLLFGIRSLSDSSVSASAAIPYAAARLFIEDVVNKRHDREYQWIVSCETIAGENADLAARLDVRFPDAFGSVKPAAEFSITLGTSDLVEGVLKLKPETGRRETVGMTLPYTDVRTFFRQIDEYLTAYNVATVTVREFLKLGVRNL